MNYKKEQMMSRRYWLMKSEPLTYSIEDLKKEKITFWDGVRNYQARNFMMKDMKPGDLALFYHSNAKPPGIAGLMEIASTAKPDPTAWDKNSPYYDPKSPKNKPRWFGVDVKFKQTLSFISLEKLRSQPSLKNMLVLKKGQRLSIQPVAKNHFDTVIQLARAR